MRQAHIIVSDGKGGHRLIGPGPADKVRAEAAKLDSGILYIDGRNPRKIGFKSADAYFATVAQENVAMLEAQKEKAKPTKAKPAAAAPKKSKEVERIKREHNERIAKREAGFKSAPEPELEETKTNGDAPQGTENPPDAA
jgi:hypothetical protein